MANVVLFAVHRIVSEYAERIYAYMENAKKLLVYLENTPRAIKMCISQLIKTQI
jgi:hypothetical protein